MEQNLKPDYGLLMKSQSGLHPEHHFVPFTMFGLDRIGGKLYSTTSNIHLDSICYAVTIDFPEAQYLELLKIIPNDFAKLLQNIFSGPFINTQFVNFPYPINVGITAKLGEPIENDEEEYVPFKATHIHNIK